MLPHASSEISTRGQDKESKGFQSQSLYHSPRIKTPSPNFSPMFLHVGDFHSFKCTEYNVVSYLLHCIMYCYNVLTDGAALLITKFMTHLGIFPAEKSSRFRYPSCKLSLLVQSVLYTYYIHVAVKYITQC